MGEKQRTAVVTAAASGIGLAIAAALVRDGYRVVMSDIDGERGEAEAARIGAEFRRCDVRDESELVALFAGLKDVHALVNNVGIAGPTAPAHTLDVAAFRDTLEVNLVSHLRACQLAVPGMIRRKAGVIVSLASIAGRICHPNRSAYCASKWGVLGLVRTLAIELGPHDIRVNAVLPGPVAGARMERIIADVEAAEGVDSATAEHRYLRGQAIQRFIEPTEVADVVAYLCSDRAASISGAFYDVNSWHA